MLSFPKRGKAAAGLAQGIRCDHATPIKSMAFPEQFVKFVARGFDRCGLTALLSGCSTRSGFRKKERRNTAKQEREEGEKTWAFWIMSKRKSWVRPKLLPLRQVN
jgi:hypothetical protein